MPTVFFGDPVYYIRPLLVEVAGPLDPKIILRISHHGKFQMRGKHSTVVLFVQGLPADATSRELKSFVRMQLNATGFKARTVFSGPIGDCNVLRITDSETGAIEFHSLIEIRPAELAMRAIDSLNGADFRGCPLIIRRYHQRSAVAHPQGRMRGATIKLNLNDEPQPERRRARDKIELIQANARGLFAF